MEKAKSAAVSTFSGVFWALVVFSLLILGLVVLWAWADNFVSN